MAKKVSEEAAKAKKNKNVKKSGKINNQLQREIRPGKRKAEIFEHRQSVGSIRRA